MGKYERRSMFRRYRQAGVPFMLALKLARAQSKLIPAGQFEPPKGYRARLVTYCDCCGPDSLRVTTEDGSRSWDFDIWNLSAR
jgi:hypothetical protein